MDLCVVFQAKIKSRFKRSTLWLLKLNQLKGQKATLFQIWYCSHVLQKPMWKKIMFFTTNNIVNNYNQDFNFLQKYSIIHLPIHPSFVIFIHIGLQLSPMAGQVKLQTEQTTGTKYRNVNLHNHFLSFYP